ncbi:YhjD/YihY/BrkB family envelope integrity protein [Streptomyces sp. ODS28]|uniref:YhjD/YihY/BrkB family envelope integrity protein n=1 Tax=Streptomyces sp. ODS28 TaxID=3136688 RepID=UPI0031F1B180
MKAPHHAKARLVTALRPAVDRSLRAHRRYTSANGDALAGALTYALLTGTAPAVLLLGTLATHVGPGAGPVRETLARFTAAVLPGQGAAAAARLPLGTAHWRPLLVLALGWAVVRMTRALRTGVRAMCGQNAGSGNPFRDAVRDVVLALALCAAFALVAVAVRLGGGGAGAAVPALWALFAAVLLGTPRPGGRPGTGPVLRAALAAALACQALMFAGRHYLAATAELHDTLYRSAGLLVGVLIWCGLCARVLLRAAAWAATACAPSVSAAPHSVLPESPPGGGG